MNWSNQLRRTNHFSDPTVSSFQKSPMTTAVSRVHHHANHMCPFCQPHQPYRRPMKISEIEKEVRKLKHESVHMINLENESQKTFQHLKNEINLLRNCFDSFSQIIIEECEQLRADMDKTFNVRITIH